VPLTYLIGEQVWVAVATQTAPGNVAWCRGEVVENRVWRFPHRVSVVFRSYTGEKVRASFGHDEIRPVSAIERLGEVVRET